MWIMSKVHIGGIETITQALAHSEVTRRAVGYLRRSTDKQEQSIGDQRKALIHYAEAHGIEIVDYFVDDAISGTSTTGRKAFQQMMADAQKPGRVWNTILVFDVKRFGRTDNDEAGFHRHTLRQNGVEIFYVSENFRGDTSDSLVLSVKQWQSREESRDLSKVTIRGLLSKIQSGGWWMGGAPPIGYDLRYENDRGDFLFTMRHLSDGSKEVLDQQGKVTRKLARGETLSISKKDRAKLIPGDPAKIQVVQDIFRMYVIEGRGYMGIADVLNRKGIPSPRGPAWSRIYSGKWGDSTVREIILNPHYGGDLVWNRRTDGRFHQIRAGVAVPRAAIHSRRLVHNNHTDWIRIKAAHPPLVSPALFEEAQKRRATRGGNQTQRKQLALGGWSGSRSRFVLSGLLVCGTCGNRYHGLFRIKGRPRKDHTSPRIFLYACSGYIRSGPSVCKWRPIPQEEIEGVVTRSLLEYYSRFLGEAGKEKLEKAVREHIGATHHDVEKALRRARSQHKKIEKKIANLLDHINPENRDLVDSRLKTLRQEKDECDQRLQQLDAIASSQTQVESMVEDAGQFITRLEKTFTEGVPEEKRAALRRCLEKVSVLSDGKRVISFVRNIPFPETNAVKIESQRPSTKAVETNRPV